YHDAGPGNMCQRDPDVDAELELALRPRGHVGECQGAGMVAVQQVAQRPPAGHVGQAHRMVALLSEPKPLLDARHRSRGPAAQPVDDAAKTATADRRIVAAEAMRMDAMAHRIV